MKKKRDEAEQKAVGKRLVWTRNALELGQAQIAKVLEITPQRYSNYETGYRPLDIDLAKKMVARWRLTLDWFYLGDDSALPSNLRRKIADEQKKDSR